MAKYLVVRFSSIGDIVLTTPVIRCLKQQRPEIELHYLTKRNYADLLRPNPYVDKLWLLGDSWSELIAALQREHFDGLIDLHNNLRTLRLTSALRVPTYRFDKLNLRKWVFTTLKINRMPKIHIVDRYMATVTHLGVVNDQKGLDYFIPKSEEIGRASLPASHRAGYVAYAIGGQHATKKLPVGRMIELCRGISWPIILLGGPEDAANGAAIQQALGEERILNGCGRYRLHQSASLVAQAEVVITHDTGLMHIAAAFKKKVYSIWGNTVPDFGMYPYLTDFEAIENTDLFCRPCSKIGYKACPLGHFKCMNELSLRLTLPPAPSEGDSLR